MTRPLSANSCVSSRFARSSNTRRRTLDRETEREAARRAERQINARSPHALVLADEDWHQGVVGIVASSIVERFYRPTVLLTAAEAGEGEDLLKGSARSVSGVNVYDALAGCSELLEQFGGHDYAAGLTLRRANLDAFRERFDDAVGAQVTSPEVLHPVHKVDAPLALEDIGSLKERFWTVLKQFAPHGPSNAKPVFHARNLALARSPRRVGSDGKHLKFTVRPGDGGDGPVSDDATMDAIAFGLGDKFDVLEQSRSDGQPLELLFSVEENTWNGRTSLQLKVRDVRLQDDGAKDNE